MLAWIFCRSSLQQTRNNFCLPSDIIHKYGIRKAPEKCTSFQLTHFICPASLFACTLCSLFMALIFSLCSAPRSERWSCRLIQADCNGVRSGWNERDGRVFFLWHPAVTPIASLNMYQDCRLCCEKVPVITGGFILARTSLPLWSS